MRLRDRFCLTSYLLIAANLSLPDARAAEDGVKCRIDQTSFVGDSNLDRIDYVIPPGGKPPRFRLLAGHDDDAAGAIGVELKAHEVINVGAFSLDQEPTWKSVIKLPKLQDSPITSGAFVFTHFDPVGDLVAEGNVQFQTGDGHRGSCSFRLKMDVVDLGH